MPRFVLSVLFCSLEEIEQDRLAQLVQAFADSMIDVSGSPFAL